MIHELCTLLQETVTQVLVIKEVPTNMVSILTSYCAVGAFSFHKCIPVSGLYNSWSGIMCYTAVKGALGQKLEFSKTCCKQRSFSITRNFKKLTLGITFT
jgi:hypothetical protein